MTEKEMCEIEVKDHTLMLLARLDINENCITWEECINNLLERYGEKK